MKASAREYLYWFAPVLACVFAIVNSPIVGGTVVAAFLVVHAGAWIFCRHRYRIDQLQDAHVIAGAALIIALVAATPMLDAQLGLWDNFADTLRKMPPPQRGSRLEVAKRAAAILALARAVEIVVIYQLLIVTALAADFVARQAWRKPDGEVFGAMRIIFIFLGPAVGAVPFFFAFGASLSKPELEIFGLDARHSQILFVALCLWQGFLMSFVSLRRWGPSRGMYAFGPTVEDAVRAVKALIRRLKQR